jgi:hypothetical protein
MANLVVQIERFVDEHFPGFVECVLIDADGVRHEFVEKVPVVSKVGPMSDSHYPSPGYIGCIIEEEWVDELGRGLVRVSTIKPWSIESVTGATAFTVFNKQVFPD